MKNKQEFVIEKGVLTEYKGPGGDVVIPEGVKEIGNQAFTGCKGLASVTIPKSVEEIDKSVFENSRPAIIAPHIPIDDFAPANKPGAACGFAKAYLDGMELDKNYKL